MIKKKDLSHEDKDTWEKYIKNPSDIYDKEKAQLSKNQTKERYIFDLHGYSLEDANVKVSEIINYCVNHNYRELLLITGKGIHSKNVDDIYVSNDFGKLRHSVPEYIKKSKELSNYILDFKEAPKKYGGDGAFILRLKKL